MCEVKSSPSTAEREGFLQGYLTCALWSSTQCDEQGNNCKPLDDDYGVDDIAEKSMTEQKATCTDFINGNIDALREATSTPGYTWSSAGHDFWLTRCRHGAGFWDRGLGEAGDKLTQASKVYGNCDPYVGDDDCVYFP